MSYLAQVSKGRQHDDDMDMWHYISVGRKKQEPHSKLGCQV